MSRTNRSWLPGGTEALLGTDRYTEDPPDGQCYGCWKNKREPWEHQTWCPRWHVRSMEMSGA